MNSIWSKTFLQEVLFLVIGGYATKFFGCRTTMHDLDILIDNSPSNASRVYPALVTALNKLGYSPAFTEQDLTLARKQLRFPNEMVDVLTLSDSDRVDFAQAWERCERSIEEKLGSENFFLDEVQIR